MAISNVIIDTADGPMPAVFAEPVGNPNGAVIVIHEAFGLTAHIGNLCERLSESGWFAVAPALFHRDDSPVLSYDDYDAVKPFINAVTSETIDTDVDATCVWLDQKRFMRKNQAIVGFCMGGAVALWRAAHSDIGAAATFYGGGTSTSRFGLPPLIDVAKNIRIPWIGFYGDNDQGIPVEDVERIRAKAQSTDVPTEVVRYADAGHGFNNNDRSDHFHDKSADDAWSRMLDWFSIHAGMQ